jgi:hypothetical protein
MQTRAHLFSPMYPTFSALGGVTEELNGSSDVRRHKSNKPSPPWVCAKCAKKHPAEMGCGETVDEPVVIPDYETLKLYAVRTTDDVGAVLGDCGNVHRTSQEQLGCSKCKEGQRKKRKAAAEAAAASQISGGIAYYTPYNMHGQRYPLMNGNRIGQQFTPLVPPPPPGPSTGAVVATVGIGLLFAGTLAYGIFAKRRRR